MNKDIRVLVVDDFSTMRRTTKNILIKLGFENIDVAEDGIKALSILKTQKIGLILCDWNMPKMNGLDLLKAVRNDEKLKHIPFIMITAEGRKTRVFEAIKSGVNNYLIKPFSADAMSEKIEKVLTA